MIEEREESEAMNDDIIEVLEDDGQYTDTLEDEPVQAVSNEIEANLEKEQRRKAGMEKLEEVAKAIQEAMGLPNASQRRAQFAASGSSSGSGSRPKKKCARRTFY